jgi:hypothetical protein
VRVFIATSRQTLANALRDYGEGELADRAANLSDSDLSRIGVLAGRILTSGEYSTPSGASPLIAKAYALAAVEIIEGRHRPLARKRRRFRHEKNQPIPEQVADAVASMMTWLEDEQIGTR